MPLEDKPRLLIIEARYHDVVSDALLKGASVAIKGAGSEFDVVTVPGALELPAAVALAEEGGHRPAGIRYDGYVVLGCVIRGETYDFEVIANTTALGLMDLSIGRRLAIGSGVLTVDTINQAAVQARPDKENRGGKAALACLEMIALSRRLLGQSRG
jgi:6,7-dimethyl-8-ribityllumazine synthase